MGSRREAGLPHAIVAVLLLSLVFAGAADTLAYIVLLAGGAGLLAGLAAAWRSGWPRWSASWIMDWLAAAIL